MQELSEGGCEDGSLGWQHCCGGHNGVLVWRHDHHARRRHGNLRRSLHQHRLTTRHHYFSIKLQQSIILGNLPRWQYKLKRQDVYCHPNTFPGSAVGKNTLSEDSPGRCNLQHLRTAAKCRHICTAYGKIKCTVWAFIYHDLFIYSCLIVCENLVFICRLLPRPIFNLHVRHRLSPRVKNKLIIG